MDKDIFIEFRKRMKELYALEESIEPSETNKNKYLIRGESEIGELSSVKSIVDECPFTTEFHVRQYWQFIQGFPDAEYMLLSMKEKPYEFKFGDRSFCMFERS